MAQLINFTKGHGTGNDFVLIFDPEDQLALTSSQIAKLCDRHFGIGADGLIRIVPSSKLAAGRDCLAAEPNATWFMDYYNADGSSAEMCGNGTRVFARYLTERVLKLDDGETLSIGTRDGVKDLQRNMVVALASDEELSELSLHDAPVIEPRLESGANVEFVVPAEPMVKEGVGYISMRVHERGVGETLSCGTGIVAAALATRHWAGPGAPNQWQVKVPGGTLGVRMFAAEDGEMVGLSGAAELVFDGQVDLEQL